MVMKTVDVRIRIGAFVAAVSAMLFVGVLPTGASVEAHGSSTNPPSRYYTCRFLEPENPNCAAAWSSNSQALYDWNEVNIGDVNGQHRARIPDGQLCSAGRSKYAAFDVANSEWPATDVSSGPFTMTYTATAPHATAYFKLYLTNSDYNPNQPLAWDDLSLVYDSGSIARQSSYAFNMNLPERSGRHILYLVWQRSDSPEAFYACNDVNFGGTQHASADDCSADDCSADDCSADDCSADDRSADDRSANDRSANDRSADDCSRRRPRAA